MNYRDTYIPRTMMMISLMNMPRERKKEYYNILQYLHF